MQTKISTTEMSSSSLLGAGLLFETNPPGTGNTGPIDPPDNTGGGGTTSQAEPEEEETTSESQ